MQYNFKMCGIYRANVNNSPFTDLGVYDNYYYYLIKIQKEYPDEFVIVMSMNIE